MYLYTKSTRYDRNTGKQVDPILSKCRGKFICDYTGVLYDTDEDDTQMRVYELSLDYNHDSEPAWYEEYHEFEKEFGIGYGDFSQFLQSPFHFANTEAYGPSDFSFELIQEWMTALKSKKKVRFKGCYSIEQVLTELRLDMLRTLLREKKFTLEQLGFTHMSKEV